MGLSAAVASGGGSSCELYVLMRENIIHHFWEGPVCYVNLIRLHPGVPFAEPIHSSSIPTEAQQPEHSWVSIAMSVQPRDASLAQPCKARRESTLEKPTWI